MPSEKTESEMIREMYQLMLGKGGCWERGAKTQKDFSAFRLAVIMAGVLLSSGTGFSIAKVLELVTK